MEVTKGRKMVIFGYKCFNSWIYVIYHKLQFIIWIITLHITRDTLLNNTFIYLIGVSVLIAIKYLMNNCGGTIVVVVA